MTNVEQIWQRHARIWSSDEALRARELPACVDEARLADISGFFGTP